MTFYCVSIRKLDANRISFWQCGNCWKGICAESRDDFSIYSKNKGTVDYSKFFSVYPEPKTLNAPKHTPENIASSYKTAVRNLRSGNDGDYEAACIMARKTLETTINMFGGNGKTLAAKINDLASRNIITQTLHEWASEIKAVGNEAAHDEKPATKEDAEQAIYFAEMLLTYLFTLPSMIAERKKQA
jgi:HEPN domain-containing protein